MKLVLMLFVMTFLLTGCGGSNEVVYPENPTPTPPPGSLSNASEPDSGSDLAVE